MNRVLLLPLLFLCSQHLSAQHHHTHDWVVRFPDVPGYHVLACDFHQHTVFSDGSVWPDIRVQEALRDSLDAISLTEHLEYQPHQSDIPHPDRNRAFQIAQEEAKGSNLIVVNGSEITRDMPPGHTNAIFLTDANKLLHDNPMESFREAKRQGAFIFWNHPNWTAQRPDGVATLTDMHRKMIAEGLLHGIEVPSQIRHDNTLARPLRDYGPKDRVDVIITNPPFGGMEEDGIEQNFPATIRTKETADLFLVLIMHLMKDGGRGAIVLPDGTLFGEGVKTRIKEELLTQCNLHTIVRLPNGVFAPYTGIKTNLLFFTKGEPTKEIWYYEHPYPPGVKSYNKTKPIHIDEFKAEKAWWGRAGQASKRKESELAWRVPIEQIKASGYNLDIKNPNVVDPGHADPDKLLLEYQQLVKAVNDTREKLKRELQAALER